MIMQNLPAAVSPGPELDAERAARYARQVILPGFGTESQRRLANARVLVVGAGGIGSNVIPSIAAAGVGTIGIIDADVVEPSNLARQTIHGPADIGRSKVASATDSVRIIDPLVRVIGFETAITAANAIDILRDFDLVVDGSDNFPTRYLVNDAAAIVGIPLVWGAVHQYGGQAGVCWAAHGPHYRDLFPVPPAPGEIASCAEAGVLSSVCAVIGAILSAETIKLLTGVGTPLLGRVTSYDARQGTFRELDYQRDPDAAAITELTNTELTTMNEPETETEPESVPQPPLGITATELDGLLTEGAPFSLIDVREPWEAAIAAIDGSRLLPMQEILDAIDTIDRSIPLVLYCHHGPRSNSAAEYLRKNGFPGAQSLVGGIDAWARDVDPTLRTY
ncbi:MAG: sulfur-carrier protein adenylyltransferase/sulfurtransferase [Microbacteriaceae bacterium]|nr:molybdopterin biosynthesis protein MoeB [Microbacteriaceae bacterium]MDQ1550378.1 sulfur-carrier protein adenylyltransferase/sulfurtransferase [Microbacteriaceae bacterium]